MGCEMPSPLFPTLLLQSCQGRTSSPTSIPGKKKFDGCSRDVLGVPFDHHDPQKTPEEYFLHECLFGHLPPKDRRVISDQQQEMEANVLTPKTFYSFCLVLHLPPRAAAFISPFE